MLAALWFMIQTGAVVAACWWIFDHPGTVHADWLGYQVDTSMGIAFIGFVLAVIAVLIVTRLAGFLVSLPKRFKNRHSRKRRDRGFKALTLGLSAVAAGDAKLASYQAYKMRRFMPDEKGLPWLLEAQAARLRGDEPEARIFFEKLLKDEDTAFLGVRGLLQDAVQAADMDRALDLARQALAMHPDQSWIIRTVFGLEIQKREWAGALQTLKKAERAKAFPADELASNRIAILLQQGEELHRGGYQGESLKKLREANRLDPSFAPAALRLSQAYLESHKRRAAIAVIERAWRDRPHPDLVSVWNALAPANKPNDMTARLRWFERLVALKPGDAESQIAAAGAAIGDGLWGEAWQYLAAAEKIRPNARLYRLWAKTEEKTGHSESAKRYWEKAADAAADKVWTCRETGIIYPQWSPLAEPHGAFNTIVWDNPRVARAASPLSLPVAGNDLLIEPVNDIGSRA